MTERPILFSGDMVRAIISGAKTQTRRPVVLRECGKVLDVGCHRDIDAWWRRPDGMWDAGHSSDGYWATMLAGVRCPCGQPGDTLWLRETFRLPAAADDQSPKQIGVSCREAGYTRPWCPTVYEADGSQSGERRDPLFARDWIGGDGKLRPSIHMPRWASRILLRVTDVRVQRVQDITEEEARAEGFESRAQHGGVSFASAWDAIYADKAPWSANPWVWAIGFERQS